MSPRHCPNLYHMIRHKYQAMHIHHIVKRNDNAFESDVIGCYQELLKCLAREGQAMCTRSLV